MASTEAVPRAEEERGVPKPQPQRPVVSNPSTPGVQKPPNRPGGRDAPPGQETRGVLVRLRVAIDPTTGAESFIASPKTKATLRMGLVTARRGRNENQAQTVHRTGTSRERRPGSVRRTRRSSSRTGSRAGPDDPDESERAKRPRLTAEQRRWLKAEVDGRRREVVATLLQLDRELFADDPGKIR
jgi:hypothetical protein